MDDIYKLATWIYLKLVRFLPTADGLHGLAHHVNLKLLPVDRKIGMIGRPLILEVLRLINTYNSWCNQKKTPLKQRTPELSVLSLLLFILCSLIMRMLSLYI